MKITFAAAASVLCSIAPFTSALLVGALTGGCVAGPEIGSEEEETVGEVQEALTDFTALPEESTANFTGKPISPNAGERCFLSGVAGNLNQGDTFGGPASLPATAAAIGTTLYGHGGAYTDVHNDRVPYNNRVKASTACLPSTYAASQNWSSNAGGTSAPVWITALGTSLRQCFLTGVTGVTGSWNSSTRFARVVKITTTDATHPTTGWYVEGNLIDEPFTGSHAKIMATCVDFPTGTVFASAYVYATEGGSTSVPIGGALGNPVVKGCALTEIVGAFNVNDATQGVVIDAPTIPNTGSWIMTVTDNRQGRAVCAK